MLEPARRSCTPAYTLSNTRGTPMNSVGFSSCARVRRGQLMRQQDDISLSILHNAKKRLPNSRFSTLLNGA